MKNAGKQNRQTDRARMNRQRQREREIQRQRERQQNNDMMTESVVLMSLCPRAINILISNWSRTRKFSQSFKNTSREAKRQLFIFLTIVTRWSRSMTVPFLCCDWSKFDRWFMQKIYTASWNLFTLTAEADWVFCHLEMIFTVFFHWMHKMKYSCYQQSSVIHGWFFCWIFGWEMRRLFGWHRFRFSPCWMRVEKSFKRFWPYLIAFRSCISNGKPE